MKYFVQNGMDLEVFHVCDSKKEAEAVKRFCRDETGDESYFVYWGTKPIEVHRTLREKIVDMLRGK